jgi:hypothetical protein
MTADGHGQPTGVADWPNTDPPTLEPLWASLHTSSPWGLAAAVLAGVLVGWALGRQPPPDARKGRR